MNWKLIEEGIGWSRKAWTRPIKNFINDNPKILFNDSLEIGASEYGTLAPFLSEISVNITIGYFQCDIARLGSNLDKFDFSTAKEFVDVTKINGTYDLIVVKSVLGGVYRKSSSTMDNVAKLIDNIMKDHLNQDGALLLLDNGESFFEGVFSKLGARKNKWRFFRPEDFIDPSCQYTFGFLSCFSFETRIGAIGKILDSVLYFFDLFLSKVTRYPTVILTVYRKK